MRLTSNYRKVKSLEQLKACIVHTAKRDKTPLSVEVDIAEDMLSSRRLAKLAMDWIWTNIPGEDCQFVEWPE